MAWPDCLPPLLPYPAACPTVRPPHHTMLKRLVQAKPTVQASATVMLSTCFWRKEKLATTAICRGGGMNRRTRRRSHFPFPLGPRQHSSYRHPREASICKVSLIARTLFDGFGCNTMSLSSHDVR